MRIVKVSRQGADGRHFSAGYALEEIEESLIPDPSIRAGDRIEVSRAKMMTATDSIRTSVLPHLHRRCIILCGKFDRTPAGALSRQPVIDKHHHSHPPVGGNGLDHA